MTCDSSFFVISCLVDGLLHRSTYIFLVLNSAVCNSKYGSLLYRDLYGGAPLRSPLASSYPLPWFVRRHTLSPLDFANSLPIDVHSLRLAEDPVLSCPPCDEFLFLPDEYPVLSFVRVPLRSLPRGAYHFLSFLLDVLISLHFPLLFASQLRGGSLLGSPWPPRSTVVFGLSRVMFNVSDTAIKSLQATDNIPEVAGRCF